MCLIANETHRKDVGKRIDNKLGMLIGKQSEAFLKIHIVKSRRCLNGVE